MYTRLVSGLLFPLHERLKRHDSVAVRRRMEAEQWWHAERIADRQAIQGAPGAVDGRTHLATDARMLSTSAMSIIGL